MISALCCSSLLCLFVFAKVGLDLDNSDYAFEHVGHNHVRFELKDANGDQDLGYGSCRG